MLLDFFYEFFTWIMLFVILINISQRKIPDSDNKRRATLLLAVVFLIIYVMVIMCSTFSLPTWTQWASLALGIAVIAIFHKVFWPFRLHCSRCGKRLEWNSIIGNDDNICHSCYLEAHPEEKRKEEEKKLTPREKLERSFTEADKVSDIDWDNWEPTESCVLTYVTDGDRILMIEKKTGLGHGYINANIVQSRTGSNLLPAIKNSDFHLVHFILHISSNIHRKQIPVYIRRNPDLFNVLLGHRLQPDSLPDSADRSIPDAMRVVHLLATRLETFVNRIPYFYAHYIFTFANR